MNFKTDELGTVPIVIDAGANPKAGITVRPLRANESLANDSWAKESGFVRYFDEDLKVETFARPKQKVVVLTETELARLQKGELLIRALGKQEIKQLTITVGECPNSTVDYPSPGQKPTQEPTYTVLLEWEETTETLFPRLDFLEGGRNRDPLAQANNFLISPRDPNDPPSPPVADATRAGSWASDFKTLTPDDLTHYLDVAEDINYDAWYYGPAVAVVDTGLKFNFQNLSDPPGTRPLPYTYTAADGTLLEFVPTYRRSGQPTGTGMAGNRIGYCALRDYKRDGFVDGINQRLTAAELPACTIDDVRNSPYDDQRGRHGTRIAAIIQQRANAPILSVKAFNHLGHGSLFDVLCALNHVLQRRETAHIQVLNASWVCRGDSPLLRNKFEQLLQAGIFVVAAAGNTNQTPDPNLSAIPLYPACYSRDLPNVITVTSVTPNYAYRIRGQRGPGRGAVNGSNRVERMLLDRRRQRAILRQARRNEDLQLDLIVNDLSAEANFSDQFVNVGVLAPWGYLPGPFGQRMLRGSSFAAPYITACLANYLRDHPEQVPAPSGTGTMASQFTDARSAFLSTIGTDARLRASHVENQRCFDPSL